MAINREARDRNRQRVMVEIFESLEYSLFERLEQADSVVAKMIHEMTQSGVTREMSVPFLQERFNDMLEQIVEKRFPQGWEVKNGGRVKNEGEKHDGRRA